MQDYLSRLDRLPEADATAIAAATARQAALTKPPGALGRLEEIAIWLAGWQGRERPRLGHVRIVVFAGNHGVAARGVSAYPAAVTAEMVANFRRGGAAINQLAELAGADLRVVPLELDKPTADFTVAPAMTEAELRQALAAGEEAAEGELDLLALGEMGIANTTAAAALAAALYGGGADWVGRGTGVDAAGLGRKADAVVAALRRHEARIADRADPARALAALACLGGRELAGIAGAVLRARERRIPVILDGFVATAAAAVWPAMRDGALDHCVAGHRSAERAHARLLEKLGLDPLLDLGLRLGEASGAALAILLLRAAVSCHNGMATFAEAGVSGG